MVLSDPMLFTAAMSELVGRRHFCTCANTRDLRRWFERYVAQVLVPAMTGPRSLQIALFARLRNANTLFARRVADTNSTFPCQTQSIIRTHATLAGFLFVSLTFLKRSERFIRELAALLPADWHGALYHSLDPIVAVTAAMDTLLRTCWEERIGGDLAMNYILVHINGLHGWPYPGWCQKLVEAGRFQGAPRWPMRFTAHQLCTRSTVARDSGLPRYVFYRDRGVDGLVGFPVYLAGSLAAYNREQAVIRQRRPKAIVRLAEFLRTPPVRFRGGVPLRRRPLQSARRRQRRLRAAREDDRVPALEENFNLSRFTQRVHAREVHARPQQPANFKTYYRQYVRAAAASDGNVAAPLNLLSPGNEVLLAEWGATPGKRLTIAEGVAETEQWYAMGNHISRVASDYRRRLLVNRLSAVMPEHGLPTPRPFRLRIRNSCFQLHSTIAQMLRILTAEYSGGPQERQFIGNFTLVARGRERKEAEYVISEYEGTRTFKYSDMVFLSLAEREKMKSEADPTVLMSNWDIQRSASRKDIKREITRELAQWSEYFRLGVPKEHIHALLWRFRDDFASIPDQDPLWPLGDPRKPRYVIGRRDREEHTLLRRTEAAYHCLLFEHYCLPHQFEVTRMTPDEAVAEMKLVYEAYMPARFKRPVHYSVEQIPVGILRSKAKCSANGILDCKKDHDHERLVIDTHRLPQHFIDKTFSRSWEVLKREDPWPSCELWRQKDLARVQRESRGRLVFVPRWRDVCARCGGPKPEVYHARKDCASFYTNLETHRVSSWAAPSLVERVRRMCHRTNVTVEDGPRVAGRLGGHDAGNFRRTVTRHQEMLQHLRMHLLFNLFALGDGDDMVIIRQILGAFMGGRLSKVFVSILLGEGESRFLNWQRLWEAHGFGVDGLLPTQLFSMIRIVDDGCIAATCHCGECIQHLLGLLWGVTMKITTEEEGHTIKVSDTFERYVHGQFLLFPLYPDSPHAPPLLPAKVRHIPYDAHPRPVRYIRSLLLATMHRAYQLRGDIPREIIRALLEKSDALHRHELGYPWGLILKALVGIRLRWASAPVRRVRLILELLRDADGEYH